MPRQELTRRWRRRNADNAGGQLACLIAVQGYQLLRGRYSGKAATTRPGSLPKRTQRLLREGWGRDFGGGHHESVVGRRKRSRAGNWIGSSMRRAVKIDAFECSKLSQAG